MRQVTQWVASAFLGNSKHNVWYKVARILEFILVSSSRDRVQIQNSMCVFELEPSICRCICSWRSAKNAQVLYCFVILCVFFKCSFGDWGPIFERRLLPRCANESNQCHGAWRGCQGIGHHHAPNVAHGSGISSLCVRSIVDMLSKRVAKLEEILNGVDVLALQCVAWCFKRRNLPVQNYADVESLINEYKCS
jgi:hypothetical protein